MANNKQSSGLIGSRSILTQKQIEQKYNLSPQAPVPAWVKKAIKESDDDWEGETNDLLAGKLDSLLESIRNEPEPKKKSRRKRKKASSRKMLGDVGEMGLTKSFNIILENVIESRELLFDLYKIEKQRFEFRKKIDKRLTGALDAKVREKEVEKGSGKEKENEIVVNLKKKLKRGLLETLAGGLVAAGIPIIAGAANSIKNWWDSEQDKQQIEEQKNEEKTQQDSKNTSLLMDGDVVVGRVGQTGGLNTGVHIHIETGDGYSGAGKIIPPEVLKNIIVGGNPLDSYPVTSEMGWRMHPKLNEMKYHKGTDYGGIAEGTPIMLRGGLQLDKEAIGTGGTGYSEGVNKGYGNSIVIKDKNGNRYMIAHLLSGPEEPKPKPKPKKVQEISLLDSLLGMRPAAAGEIPMNQNVTADRALLTAISALEAGNAQARVDVAQSIYNRLNDPQKLYGSSISEVITADAQYQPAYIDPNVSKGPGTKTDPAWKRVNDRNSAIDAMMSYYDKKNDPRSRASVARLFDETMAALANEEMQKLAAEHVGGRTEFLGAKSYIDPLDRAELRSRGTIFDNQFFTAYGTGGDYNESIKRGPAAIPQGLFPYGPPTPGSAPPPPPLPTPKKSLYQRFMDLFSRPPAQTPQKQHIINKDLGSKPVGTGAPQQPFS